MKFIRMKRFVFLLFVAFVCNLACSLANAQGKLEISLKIKNYPDSLNHQIYLGRYYGGSQYVIDTATYNAKNSTYTFKKPWQEPGLYMLISASKDNYAEFILDSNQTFSIECNYEDMGGSLKFKNSKANEIYQDFNKEGRSTFAKIIELQNAYKESSENGDTAKLPGLRESISKLYSITNNKKREFAEKYPKHLMSAVFKAQKDIDMVYAPDSLDENAKRMWQYEYYKEHYFDNLDLSDSRLVYTPVFHQKYEQYLSKVLGLQSPDTIKYAVERFIEKCRGSKELFKYAVWYPVDKYQRSEYVGHDAIWVHLAKKYYVGGEAFWASSSIVENFRKRIERLEPLLIGNRPPEFACPDTSVDSPVENFISVFGTLKSYTIVIFWSMTCGHCKKTMPKWLELYHSLGKELDFEIIAICKDHEVEDWKNYIKENGFDWINLCGKTATSDYNDSWDIVSTPTVYVLDRYKRIVTKKIDPEHAESFIRNWENIHFK